MEKLENWKRKSGKQTNEIQKRIIENRNTKFRNRLIKIVKSKFKDWKIGEGKMEKFEKEKQEIEKGNSKRKRKFEKE